MASKRSAGTRRRARAAGCKKGYYVVRAKNSPLFGRCAKRKQHTVVRGKGRKVLKGAARLAQMCKGNKGSAYKACLAHALDGMFTSSFPSFSRKRGSRRGRR